MRPSFELARLAVLSTAVLLGLDYPARAEPQAGLTADCKPFFEAADIAINPMLTGSGSNLKQLEFMAMGLPTVATPVGARGIPIVDDVHGLIRPSQQFPECLRQLVGDHQRRTQIGQNGRDLVQQHFEWSVVAESMVAAYQALLQREAVCR